MIRGQDRGQRRNGGRSEGTPESESFDTKYMDCGVVLTSRLLLPARLLRNRGSSSSLQTSPRRREERILRVAASATAADLIGPLYNKDIIIRNVCTWKIKYCVVALITELQRKLWRIRNNPQNGSAQGAFSTEGTERFLYNNIAQCATRKTLNEKRHQAQQPLCADAGDRDAKENSLCSQK